ncbi:DUF998 domain-containing protein [Serinibacter arcticus]|uniref:DUF998 domain-containing protein n=1 Tax=Serinibacter arcticus TaxID=1655435 RepID=A0A2U1ZTD4_9MICO|nr:DUF998 domain-containing protein [Serinibacter arcticus]PWD50182.1 DUF998 domain-containing protein [Serinibacter arcticus]
MPRAARPRPDRPEATPSAPVPTPVPVWALASAVVAPIAMIGGWTLAQALQPSFDPVRETISTLAEADRTAPVVLGAALVVTGLAHLVTAAGLGRLRPLGRAALALGGLATLAVGLLPSDAHPLPHGIAAGIGFGALALWPVLTTRRAGAPIERPTATVTASVVLLALVGSFVVQLAGGESSPAIGLTERLAAGAQSLWPLVVVLALRRRRD